MFIYQTIALYDASAIDGRRSRVFHSNDEFDTRPAIAILAGWRRVGRIVIM